MGCVKNVGATTYPAQGTWAKKRTKVCFNFDTAHIFMGTIVRDDMEAPWVCVIALDDGRYVLATECQHSPE